MKRVFIAALVFASVGYGKKWEPTEIEISAHRREVYSLALEYIVETFNLEVTDQSKFNPVRFDSYGVWGNFEARIKELGDNRFEVKGWLAATGHHRAEVPWTVHIRYSMEDPEAWRYRRIDEVYENEPEILGWKFGHYWSLNYKAEKVPTVAAAKSKRK